MLNRATADPFTDGNKPLGLSYLTKVFEECGGSPNLAKQVFEEADLRAKEFELQTKLIARLSERFHGLNTRLVPDFTGDIHDLYGLTLMENALFG